MIKLFIKYEDGMLCFRLLTPLNLIKKMFFKDENPTVRVYILYMICMFFILFKTDSFTISYS